MNTTLTGPQQALLERVRSEGTVVQNGRARRTVQALVDRGLVVSEYDLIPHAIGSWTERFTLTLAPNDSEV
jgi:hypothetical protein